VRFFIDTHYLLWSALKPNRIERWASDLIEHFDNEIHVSAASVYEISFKVRRGKLIEAAEFESDLITNIERLGFTLHSLEPEVMMRAARFADSHADPFDRMIAAHAILHDLPILSIDGKLDAFGVRRLKKPGRDFAQER